MLLWIVFRYHRAHGRSLKKSKTDMSEILYHVQYNYIVRSCKDIRAWEIVCCLRLDNNKSNETLEKANNSKTHERLYNIFCWWQTLREIRTIELTGMLLRFHYREFKYVCGIVAYQHKYGPAWFYHVVAISSMQLLRIALTPWLESMHLYWLARSNNSLRFLYSSKIAIFERTTIMLYVNKNVHDNAFLPHSRNA